MSELVAPTRYADVNKVLHSFEVRLRTLLESHFVGMYLSGSLALGDFDPQSSDIDMVIVTDVELSGELFAALHDLHAHFDESRSPWAAKVEAVYIPPEALRHSAPTPAQYPQIEKGCSLFLDHLESGWIFHCYTLREHGVVVAGPDPHTLIDPVDPHAMRRAAATIAGTWLEQAQHDADWLTWLHPRKHQAFVLLTLCRLLYTLDTGTLASKPAAALGIEKLRSEKRQAWQNYVEAHFNIARKMSDAKFARARSWEEMLAIHRSFVNDYNVQRRLRARKAGGWLPQSRPGPRLAQGHGVS